MSTAPHPTPGTTHRWAPIRINADRLDLLHSLAPLISENEDAAENGRRLPAAVVDKFRDFGLFRQIMPAELDGEGLSASVEMETYETLARVSMSAAWNLMIGATSNAAVAAYVDDNAYDQIFSNPDVVIAGQNAPIGTATRADGGLLVNGRWSWASGISHSDWVLGGSAIADPDGGKPELRIVVVPKSSVTVLDNWNVMGLSGSGSADYEMNDVFVPDGFHYSFSTPARQRGGGRFELPMLALTFAPHIGVVLGAAERAFDFITEFSAGKKRLYASGSVADRPYFQRELGRTYTRLLAARARVAVHLEHLDTLIAAGEKPSPKFVQELMATGTHVVEVAVETAAMAHKFGGGSSVRLTNPLQRILRDLLVAQQHIYYADTNYELLGATLLADVEAR